MAKQLNEDVTIRGISRTAYQSLRLQLRLAHLEAQKSEHLTDEEKEMAYLLKEYILFMVNTGIRPGKETRDIRWHTST